MSAENPKFLGFMCILFDYWKIATEIDSSENLIFFSRFTNLKVSFSKRLSVEGKKLIVIT